MDPDHERSSQTPETGPERRRSAGHTGNSGRIESVGPNPVTTSAPQRDISSASSLSHGDGDRVERVFPVRSIVSIDANSQSPKRSSFNFDQARRGSTAPNNTSHRRTYDEADHERRHSRASRPSQPESTVTSPTSPATQVSQQRFEKLFVDNTPTTSSVGDWNSGSGSATRPRGHSVESSRSQDSVSSLLTTRFKHVMTEDGHAIVTGRDGDTLQRCEDESIHVPGAIQRFGLLLALEEQSDHTYQVRIVGENSQQFIGHTPRELFKLRCFTDILPEDYKDDFLDRVDFAQEEDASVIDNGPDIFILAIKTRHRSKQKFWCAMHKNETNENVIICEFELVQDEVNPLVPKNDTTPEPPEDTLQSEPTQQEFEESTTSISKPLRVLRNARKKGEGAAMEGFNVMTQIQDQLEKAGNLEQLLKITIGVFKELTGFHRVMIYQFDQKWNGRVVAELVDPRATKDLYKGLKFPASDIPKQARDLYKINKVRLLYDRDQPTARLVCRTLKDLETPLDLTHSFLRAMSPIHLKYLKNMAVRSSMSISLTAFGELWGLVSCHTYGSNGTRVSFPVRKMCRLFGESASRNIEKLSYTSRLQARNLINTVPTNNNPSGYIVASSEELLRLFDADFGLLSIRDETKTLGRSENSQEALALLEYFRMRGASSIVSSHNVTEDFPELIYSPGFKVVAGVLLIPFSDSGQDFIVFFRKSQIEEVKWAGNPYEKIIKEGTEGYLEPRKSFKTWRESVVGVCREWTEENLETASVLCLIYGKFVRIWRQKEFAQQSSQLTQLLLANSAHEVRTPLNAVINYMEIALEGQLDRETRANLMKSHSASKSLVYVINDLLDLTKTEEGRDLVKIDEIFDLKATVVAATHSFQADAKRKGISFVVGDLSCLPSQVLGEERNVRVAISNVVANAVQNTVAGGVQIEVLVIGRTEGQIEVEVSITDTGHGMSTEKVDALFGDLEQVDDAAAVLSDNAPSLIPLASPTVERDGTRLGLGLAVVARILRKHNGRLVVKSEERKGSRFGLIFPFAVPEKHEGSTAQTESESARLGRPPVKISAECETSSLDGARILIASRNTQQSPRMSRNSSTGSAGSRNSLTSQRSASSHLSTLSHGSGKSEADRLIEALQEPLRMRGDEKLPHHLVRRSREFVSSRPSLTRSTTNDGQLLRSSSSIEVASSSKRRVKSFDGHSSAASQDLQRLAEPGEYLILSQRTPLRPLRVPDTPQVENEGLMAPSASIPPKTAINQAPKKLIDNPKVSPESACMRVLVAEDDLVNSRIIHKRLEKQGHKVILTANGEACASTFSTMVDSIDIVLMDMQMPIMDGLSSTKTIRKFEKSCSLHHLSAVAAAYGRVPIIAVSASLIENDRQTYIDAGFDGWILKPIMFNRLGEIMKGATDQQCRKDNVYGLKSWEHGGWFSAASSPDSLDLPT